MDITKEDIDYNRNEDIKPPVLYHYRYDKKTKEYIGSFIPAFSPNGNVLVQVSTTAVKSLKNKVGYSQIFTDDKWKYIEDNRNKTRYLNSEKVEFKLGDVVTDEMTVEQYTPVELLEQSKEKVIQHLADIYRTKTQEVKDYIADTSLDVDKRREYETKKRLADAAVNSADYSLFNVDATLLSELTGSTITAQQYAEMVIAKEVGWTDAEDKAILRLGSFRVYVGALISGGKIDEANAVIDAHKDIEAETIVNATEVELLQLLQLGGN